MCGSLKQGMLSWMGNTPCLVEGRIAARMRCAGNVFLPENRDGKKFFGCIEVFIQLLFICVS